MHIKYANFVFELSSTAMCFFPRSSQHLRKRYRETEVGFQLVQERKLKACRLVIYCCTTNHSKTQQLKTTAIYLAHDFLVGQQFRLSSAGGWFQFELGLADLSWARSCICSHWQVSCAGLSMIALFGWPGNWVLVAPGLSSSSRLALAFSQDGCRDPRTARNKPQSASSTQLV